MPRLLADISSHGFGHVAQTAPVLNTLAARLPALELTVRCAAPAEFLRQRICVPFEHLPVALDFGMDMASAVDVQVEESAARYREFHEDWDARVAREAQAMAALSPDLVFANAPYLSLAAARQTGIPAVGMCSLQWAGIYRHYCGARPEGPAILAQITAAYASARAFLRATPGMDMAELPNARSIGPVAQPGIRRREELAAALRLAPGEKAVLIAMGGMELRLPVERWPATPGVRWLTPPGWAIRQKNVADWAAAKLPFSDLLASCDAVLTKPGYGTFVEAACGGVPVLYVSRRDWPEEPALVAWLTRNGRCAEITREEATEGGLAARLEDLLAAPCPPRPSPTGIAEAADYLAQQF